MTTLTQVHDQLVREIFAAAGIEVREGAVYDATSEPVLEVPLWEVENLLDLAENLEACK